MPYRLNLESVPPIDLTWPLPKLSEFVASHVDRPYAKYHAPRFAFLLRLLAQYVDGPEQSILDIGASELTDLIRHAFHRNVDVLDIRDDARCPDGNLYRTDLNQIDQPGARREDLPTYDLVVMAEVFEHVYASPQAIFRFLREILAPRGLLFIQTPNALALKKRLKMVLGSHPFEPLPDDDKHGGHVREYCLPELERYGSQQGFQPLESHVHNYFDVRFASHTGSKESPVKTLLKRAFDRATPRRLGPGITLVFRAPG